MQGRPSADPEDEEIRGLQAQLAELGPLPRRLARSMQEQQDAYVHAEQEVADGQVGEGGGASGEGRGGVGEAC
jgi:hypothetical protein